MMAQLLVGLGNKCIDAQEASTDNGTPIILWQQNGGNNQKWTLTPEGYLESCMDNNKCIDIQGDNPDNGTPIILWEKNGGDNQKWRLTQEGYLESVLDSNKCIDVQGGNSDNGTPLILWEKNGGDNQKWRFANYAIPQAPSFVKGNGNILRPNEGLGINDILKSNVGNVEMIMQGDGNLVLYFKNGRDSWGTGTENTDSKCVIMQGDGNLVIYNDYGQDKWASGTDGNPGAYFILQDDGNAVIYKPDGTAIWASDTMLFNITDNGSALIFSEKKEWDIDLIGGGVTGGLNVKISKSGDIEFDGYVKKGGIQNRDYNIVGILKSQKFIVATQKSGNLSGKPLGTVTYEWHEDGNWYNGINTGYTKQVIFDDIMRTGKFDLYADFKGSITQTINSVLSIGFNWIVGSAITAGISILIPVPILLVGAELNLGISALFPQVGRVISGLFWMKGPLGILYALTSEIGISVGAASREMSQYEYDWVNNFVFKNALPPRESITITDTIGAGDRAFTFPTYNDKITLNLGNAFNNPLDYSLPSYPVKGQMFIHELVHAAQCHFWGHLDFANSGAINQVLNGTSSYKYDPSLPGSFEDYGVEAQAQIVSDWFGNYYNDKNGIFDEIGASNDTAFNFINNNVRIGKY